MTTKPTYDEVVAAYDSLVMEKERLRAALNEIAEMGPHTVAHSAQTVARLALRLQ